MLNVEPKEIRKTRSFTLRPSTIATIEELSKAYDTNCSRVIESMVIQFGTKLLEQKTNRRTVA